MKLATTDSVLARVSINPSLSGAVSSADASLEAATVLLANMLESELNKIGVRDYFSPGLSNVGGSLKLYLSRMFLLDGVTLSYGTYSGDVDTDTYTEISPLNYSIDYESGAIKLDTIPTYGKMSIKVSYFSGFIDETDPLIPTWLNEAAITTAVYVMHTQVAAHGKQDILDISPEYRRLIYTMIQQHIRPRMNCLFAETSFTTVI